MFIIAFQGRRQDFSRGGSVCENFAKTTPVYSQTKRHSVQHNYEGVFFYIVAHKRVAS